MLDDLNTSSGQRKQIEKQFSTRSNFTPQGKMGKLFLVSSGSRPGMLLNILQHKTAPKHGPALKVDNAEVEESYDR